MAHSYKGKVIFMPTIQLFNDSSSTVTSVSNIFIDEFMPEANGEFVKVYYEACQTIPVNVQFLLLQIN